MGKSAQEDNSGTAQAPTPSWREALLFWLKLGFISFGGPAGQIAIMHQELVERRRWISESRFLHALNYCMLLPGPEAQQLATYIGWLMHRTVGGLVAGILFVLPSLLILIGLSWLYMAFGEKPLVAGIFYGIKPAVAAIVFLAAWRIGLRVLKHRLLWAIAAGSFFAIFALQLPFPAIIAAAALTGYLASRLVPQVFANAGATSHGLATIDELPRQAHTHFSWRRLGVVLAIGGALWFLPMLALAISFGWEHTWTQLGWFFTKAALLTFGGAYAVLPYVYQGAVDHYNWLNALQMIDGLALGETTPGPLIMVVAFVGFVAAWGQALLGPEQLFLAGALAAVLVTWFTFLPSFVFILAGGPVVESTHGELSLTAPLTAVTAAVVGVIVNLALFFAYHALWPQGFSGGVDFVSVFLMLAAGIALFRFRQGVIPVIAACATVGLLSACLAG
ncbi:MAG: chromate transporter [Betaproteobacteria bacterium HGW-Betaproteobacteria-7]|nr:MAG: chromate transporter [Betaproteobacteria bacterium HGW-Betaproteobacteria-7]